MLPSSITGRRGNIRKLQRSAKDGRVGFLGIYAIHSLKVSGGNAA